MKLIAPFLLIMLLMACSEKKPKNLAEKVDATKIEVETTKLAPQLKLSDVEMFCLPPGSRSAQIYGGGVTFHFTIENQTGIGIKTIYLRGDFQHEGRTLSYSDEFNYEFRKGLEPNESQELYIKPNALSDWNNMIKPGDQGDFTLEVLAIEDYDGNKRL